MVGSILDQIRSRGYWQVVVRPSVFKQDRVANFDELYPIVNRASVQLRGWDYPHIDQTTDLRRGQDWVGQEFQWEHFIEAWCLYQSGQFIHISGFPYDWKDQSSFYPNANANESDAKFSVGDALFRLTEIYEFAARLALSEAGDYNMLVSTKIGNLKNRTLTLQMPNRSGLIWEYRLSGDDTLYYCSGVVAHEDLVANAKDLAIFSATEVFKRFGWSPSEDVLRELQSELLRR